MMIFKGHYQIRSDYELPSPEHRGQWWRLGTERFHLSIPKPGRTGWSMQLGWHVWWIIPVRRGRTVAKEKL
jgi:hypothetical protein